MNEQAYQNHLAVLREELVPALGCTEPIALAYAGALARKALDIVPEHCVVWCSGNIIKNAAGVIVPNSGDQRGVQTAVTLGIVGGDPDRELAVLQDVTPAEQAQARQLCERGFCDCKLAENVPNLYILVRVEGGGHWAEVEIRDHHSHVVRISRDGEELPVVQQEQHEASGPSADRTQLSIRSILEFADCARMEDAGPVLKRQIACNTRISREGFCGNWGAQVGKTLLESKGDRADFTIQARAAAAAGSDARMNGCPLPVIINSGSGNQGITVSVPLAIYAREYSVPEETLLRGLIVSNLISVHQKKYIGSLSAYCGATSAACGSACGVAYMMLAGEKDRRYRIICDTITNCICTIGGMVCDGAKSSCAAKISVALETAFAALQLALNHHAFQAGEGLVRTDAEETIAAVGRMGRRGMHTTDVEILNIMLGNG